MTIKTVDNSCFSFHFEVSRWVMLSKKAKYGIRSLVYLAKHSRNGAVLSRKIASEEKIPKKYLESVLLELKNAGFLDSKPGKGGGYVLRLLPNAIKLSQIIRILNGPLALVCAATIRIHQ